MVSIVTDELHAWAECGKDMGGGRGSERTVNLANTSYLVCIKNSPWSEGEPYYQMNVIACCDFTVFLLNRFQISKK